MSHAILAFAFATLAPAIAAAQSAPTRVWGVGAGAAIGRERTSVSSEHTFLQPLNLEVRAALSRRLELAVHVPLASMLYANVLDAEKQRFVWLDAFAVWYPLRESSGLFLAPGLGMLYGSNDDASGVALELPARIGWEFGSRGSARALAVRPWFDVVFPSGNVDIGTRYGVIVELTLIGYATESPPRAVVTQR